ncbi:hypothetical protein [Elongatibacter sediminis]|uniref:Uncharacterized protein n=1 Tax=Elongatibacter sediminis TaxID=3119006 RepID=A0AAW9REG7_9GAMM
MIAFKKKFGEAGAVIAGKASLADGLDLADAMVGVMNPIALMDGNEPSPREELRTAEKKLNESTVYNKFGYKSSHGWKSGRLRG